LWNFYKATEQPFRLDVRTYTANKANQILTRTRLYVSRRDTALRSRIALIPFKIGQPLPKISWDSARANAALVWPDQKDTLVFSPSAPDTRTSVTVRRDGVDILSSVRLSAQP
jgi:hypothetical protein